MTTYAAGSQVLSADLNAWQASLYGERTLLIPAYAAFVNTGTADSDWFANVDGHILSAATDPAVAKLPITLVVGDRIKSVTARVRGTTAGAVAMKVYKVGSTGTVTQIGSTQTSGTAGTDESLAVTGLTETVATDTAYWIELSKAGASIISRIYYAKVVVDHP